MKLSERQQQRISRYLREVRARLVSLPEEERQEAISRLAARIRREIEQYGEMPPTDQAIENVLKTCGSPASQASGFLGTTDDGDSLVSWPDRVWLGVCGGLAERFDLPPFAVRGVALVLGLILPLLPFALIVYLGLFFFGYAQVNAEERPRIAVAALVKDLAKAFAIALGLFLGSKALLWFLAYAHGELFNRALVFANRWGWLLSENTTLFAWALMLSLPIAVLAALPVPEAWRVTLRKVWQAILALYAVMVCFGVACLLVGTIIRAAEDLGGPAGIPFLGNMLRM